MPQRSVASLLASFLFLPLCVSAADIEEQWMALLLDGVKTGHMHSVRTVHEDRVESSETYNIEIKRSGVVIGMAYTDTVVETLDGDPLAFSSHQFIGGGEMIIEGTVAEDGTVTVTTTSAGDTRTQTFEWPEGALMAEGVRLATLEAGTEPGTIIKIRAFVPSSLQSAPVTVTLGEREKVDLFGVEYELIRAEQVMDMGNTEMAATAWVDDDLMPLKMRFALMGLEFETIACPKECATSMAEPAEFFTQAFVKSPSDLSREVRDDAVTYRIRGLSDDMTLHFPSSTEQIVTQTNGALEVTVRVIEETPAASPVTVEGDYLASTRWLQSDQSEILELAAKGRGNAQTERDTMRNLESFVRRYVSDKNLSVGYASALDTARNRSGDCTEHALLLAALGRALGIPTRIATGVAYVDRWLGAEDVFVPHAWVQAYVDGRWVSYDAALGRFDAGHLALSYGDGDPWNFYDGVNTLGNFVIESAEAH